MIKVFINGWHLGMHGVGQGAYAWRLIDGMRKHADMARFDMTVFVPEGSARDLSEKLTPLRVEGRPVPRMKHEMISSLLWNVRLLKELKNIPDESVFFSPGPCWGTHTPHPMVITYHDCIYRHFPVYLGRRGVRRWMAGRTEAYLHKANLVITESEHARKDIASWTGISEENIASVPAWLPSAFTSQHDQQSISTVRHKYRLPDRYWLYLGGYDIRKNIAFLISAYAETLRRKDCPALVLAGKVPQAPATAMCDVQQARRQAGLSHDELIEPGFIEDQDLPLVYAGAELFIFPSLMEGFGLPPMEAMGCGCPAIVADNSSLREVVTDERYRFNTDDTNELCTLLEQAAEKPFALNPGFDPQSHDEKMRIQEYLELIAQTLSS